MVDIKVVVIVGLAASLAACTIPTRQVRVLKSDAEIRVLRLTIEDGDVMSCDNNTCKVVGR